jgi:hypothetical protein
LPGLDEIRRYQQEQGISPAMRALMAEMPVVERPAWPRDVTAPGPPVKLTPMPKPRWPWDVTSPGPEQQQGVLPASTYPPKTP